ncbi:hypothetical protein EQG49_00730 [Periweissella cryptocerci]|uniref:Uncharacterized protein n=1 Tax=Periweissella cryptocerci TaxID=2506420 RepID=A0A4P6YR25_9LACO|nr:hypothetical protein [Periweissella cryptocerci]QBO35079.1 hypothetical protein EQG49_00730 [Periweissella cryptocerci]
MDKKPTMSREEYRRRKEGTWDNQPTEPVHTMNDGRFVDENGEIHPGESQDVKTKLRKNRKLETDAFGDLTVKGKEQRLKRRLNIAIIVLSLLIIATYLILRFVG